jgi:serine protease Do
MSGILTTSLSKQQVLVALVLMLSVAIFVSPALADGGDDKTSQENQVEKSHEKPRTTAAPKNTQELKSIQDRVEKVVTAVMPSVVGVKVGSSGGSGVIVSEEGLVLTAGHVVRKPGEKVTFYFADGKQAKGVTLGMFKSNDAGMMKITDQGKWPVVELGDSAAVATGSWSVAVGHPFGYRPGRPPVVRLGRILRNTPTTIQTDCPLISGDSGGPLFDLDGKLIGINSRIGGQTEQNYHVPTAVFQEHWDRLQRGDAWETDFPERDDSDVMAAFRGVVDGAGECVVRVTGDGKDVSLGTIVGPDGWILTKASELDGKTSINCVLKDGRDLEALVVGISKPLDLAMLKIETTGLPRIDWSTRRPKVGNWLASAGLKEDPVAVGTLSVPMIAIPPIGGKLGVVVSDGENGPHVVKVLPNTGAQKAGLLEKDVITHIDGKPMRHRIDLTTAISKKRLGDTLRIQVKRGDKSVTVEAKLLPITNEATKKRDILNASSTGLSRRRDAFPAVLQHDTVLKPIQCGGPVVDLTGKVVGVNIARGGRTETYCIPSDMLLRTMYDLMSGRLSPPKALPPKKEPPAEKPDEKKEEPKPEEMPETKPKEEPEAKPPATDKEEKPKPKPEKEKPEEKKPEPPKEQPKPGPKPEETPDPKKDEAKSEAKPEAAEKGEKKSEPQPNPNDHPDKKPEAEKSAVEQTVAQLSMG